MWCDWRRFLENYFECFLPFWWLWWTKMLPRNCKKNRCRMLPPSLMMVMGISYTKKLYKHPGGSCVGYRSGVGRDLVWLFCVGRLAVDRPGLYTVRLTLLFFNDDERRGDGITLDIDDLLRVRVLLCCRATAVLLCCCNAVLLYCNAVLRYCDAVLLQCCDAVQLYLLLLGTTNLRSRKTKNYW